MVDGERRNGPILLLVGLLVVGAGVAGYFLMSGDDPPPPVTASEGTSASPPARDAAMVDNRVRSAPDAAVEADIPGDRPPAPAPPPSIPGMPQVKKRADGRELPPALTSQFSAQINTAIRDCGTSIPAENRAGSRMTGILTLGIAGGTARIGPSNLTLTDVPDGPGKTAALSCLQKAIVGLAQPTTEADLSEYEIAVSLFLFPAATGAAKNAAVQPRGGSAQ